MTLQPIDFPADKLTTNCPFFTGIFNKNVVNLSQHLQTSSGHALPRTGHSGHQPYIYLLTDTSDICKWKQGISIIFSISISIIENTSLLLIKWL